MCPFGLRRKHGFSKVCKDLESGKSSHDYDDVVNENQMFTTLFESTILIYDEKPAGRRVHSAERNARQSGLPCLSHPETIE